MSPLALRDSILLISSQMVLPCGSILRNGNCVLLHPSLRHEEDHR